MAGLLGAVGVWPGQGAAKTGISGAKKGSAPTRLLAVMLRGGPDGLSLVAPYDDPAYLRARPTLALPGPGAAGGVIDLGEGFGLHPALSALGEYWKQGRLAVVHACGAPIPARDHETAQKMFESGRPDDLRATRGWINNLEAALRGSKYGPPVSFAPKRPLIMRGLRWTRNIKTKRPVWTPPTENGIALYRALSGLYAGGAGADPALNEDLSKAFAKAEAAHAKRVAALDAEMKGAGAGAPPISKFPEYAARFAGQWKRYKKSRLGFLGFSGFDTHIAQGGADGLAERLRALDKGFAALEKALPGGFKNTVVVAAGEFGRSLAENALGGTENGRGGVYFVLGDAVRGGRMYGEWPGLAQRDLDRGRDLAVAVDYREVLCAAATRHLGLPEKRIGRVFKGYAYKESLSGMFA